LTAGAYLEWIRRARYLAAPSSPFIIVPWTPNHAGYGSGAGTIAGVIMPIHDWSRVDAGVFHDFHLAWMVELRNAFNTGILPPDYYAMTEHYAARDLGLPDATTFPNESECYLLKQRTLAIRHGRDDRTISLVEIVSPEIKSDRDAFLSFLQKVAASLAHGCQLLIIDLQPPSPRDLMGSHSAIWEHVGDGLFMPPPEKPLTVVAYIGGEGKQAYVEPIAVGELLPDMPLFFDPRSYVLAPLEKTYQAAYRGVPQRWRSLLET
jgi:hypothetical protein